MTDSALPGFDVRLAAQPRELRFPGLVGIFLGFSLCLHLAAVVYFAFDDTLYAAVCVLCGQFLFGLSILRLVDGAFVFQDIRLLFLIVFFLYGATLPLVVAFGVQGSQPGSAGAAFMYATGMFGFNFVQWWYRQPWHDEPKDVFQRYRPSFANAVVVFFCFVWIIYYLRSRGNALGGGFNRESRNWIGTQTWVVSTIVMNGFVMYMFIGWSKLSRQARVLLVVAVSGFVLLQLSFGNRRDFIAMFLLLAGVIATRRHLVIRCRTLLLGDSAFG